MPDETAETQAPTTETPEQRPLPGTDDAAAARAEAEKARAELDKMKAKERKAKSEADARAKEKAAKEAIENGKAAEELRRAHDELAQIRAEKEALETATRERIENTIKRLPEAARKDIELVKDSLPLDKLDAFVSMKFESAGPQETAAPDSGDKPAPSAPPTPGIKGADRSRSVGHEIDPVTREVLDEMHTSPRTVELSKELAVDSTGKFHIGLGNKNPDDYKANTGAFIHLLDSIKAVPIGGVSDDAAYDRVLKK